MKLYPFALVVACALSFFDQPSILAAPINPYRGAGDPLTDPIAITLADGKLKIIPHAQYWFRFETDGLKDFAPGTNQDFIRHRARIGLQVDAWEYVSLMLQAQDVREWGEETDPLADDNAEGLDMHQAWAQLKYSGAFLRIGRQELVYDGHRLIGNVPWTMQAQAFDAVRGGYESDGVKLHAWWAKLKEPDNTTATTEADLVGFWGQVTRSTAFTPSFLFIYDSDEATERRRFTMGLYAKGSPLPNLTYEAEGYYQAGRLNDAATRATSNISAFLAAGRCDYLIDALPWAIGIGGFFDYLSGDDNPTDGRTEVFDTLFATNHKFYGYMDFFLNIPLHTQGHGLVDTGGRLSIQPVENGLFFIDVHQFFLPESVAVGATRANSVGQELDAVWRWTPFVNPQVTLETGFSVFFPQVAGACIARGGPDCRPDATVSSGTTADNEYFGYAGINTVFN